MKIFCLLALIALSVLTLAPAVAAEVTEGAETPDAVVKAMFDAGRSADGSALIAQVVPENRAKFVEDKVLEWAFAVMFADGYDGYSRILKEHGLPDIEELPVDDFERSELLASADQAALLSDLLAYMKSVSAEQEGSDSETADETLQNLVVTGEFAQGTIDDEDFYFARKDGRWYFRMVAEGAQSPEAVVAGIHKATLAGDGRAMMSHIAPKDRGAAISLIMFQAMMASALGDHDKDELEKVLKKHGVSEDADAEDLGVLAGRDQAALMTDLVAFLRSGFGDGDPSAASEPQPLTELEVRATGMVGGDEVHFIRENGRWYQTYEDE